MKKMNVTMAEYTFKPEDRIDIPCDDFRPEAIADLINEQFGYDEDAKYTAEDVIREYENGSLVLCSDGIVVMYL